MCRKVIKNKFDGDGILVYLRPPKKNNRMGKGDVRSKLGKMKNGSFGKSRSKRALKATNTATKKK